MKVFIPSSQEEEIEPPEQNVTASVQDMDAVQVSSPTKNGERLVCMFMSIFHAIQQGAT